MNKTRVPKASPEPLPELTAFLEPFAPLFRRHTSRDSMERYLTGLLTDLPHKTCDTIADVIAGTSVERLQHLLTDAAWDPRAWDEQRVRLSVKRSSANGVLVLDDTGWPTQGNASVGVQHQYAGTLGKQGNCQIVVSAEYVVDEPSTSQPLHWPLSARLRGGFSPLCGNSVFRLAIGRYLSCSSRMSSCGSLKLNKSKLFVLGETNRVVLTKLA